MYKLSKIKNEEDFLTFDQKIIFPYDENFELKKLHPDTVAYLEQYKEELKKRDKGKKEYEAWYAFGRRQGFSKKTKGTKLIPIPGMIGQDYEFFSVPTDKTGEVFVISSGFLIETWEDEEILVFLNSRAFREYLQKVGRFWKGGYYSLGKKDLDRIFKET